MTEQGKKRMAGIFKFTWKIVTPKFSDNIFKNKQNIKGFNIQWAGKFS